MNTIQSIAAPTKKNHEPRERERERVVLEMFNNHEAQVLTNQNRHLYKKRKRHLPPTRGGIAGLGYHVGLWSAGAPVSPVASQRIMSRQRLAVLKGVKRKINGGGSNHAPHPFPVLEAVGRVTYDGFHNLALRR